MFTKEWLSAFIQMLALIISQFDLNINFALLPEMIALFFVLRATVTLDLPRALAIYVGVCAVRTLPAQFGNLAQFYFPSSPENVNLTSDFICLGLSCFIAVPFIYTCRILFYRMVDELHIPKIWYFVTALSAVFLIFNIIATPSSYDVLLEGRLRYLFPPWRAVRWWCW